MLTLLFYILLLAACLAAVALNIVSLPGNWIMLVLAVGWWYAQHWDWLRWGWLGLMLIVLLVGEAVELLGSVVGARKMGASKMASFFAIIGAMVGALFGFYIPIPLIGNIIGAILGAFVAAWVVELMKDRPFHAATRAALGAALGRGVGIVAKIGCGLAVWICLAICGWPWW